MSKKDNEKKKDVSNEVKAKDKKLSRNSIIILVFVSVFIILMLLRLCGVIDLRLNLVFEKQYNISEVKDIELDTLYYDLAIKKTSGDKIILKYYGTDKDNIELSSSNGGNLVINAIDHSFSEKKGFLKQKLVLFLPKSYIGIVDVESTDGDIAICNDYKISVNINTTNGDIALSKINKATIKSDDGDIAINKVHVLDINTIDGDIAVNNIRDEANIKTVSGDIAINGINLTNNSSISTNDGDIAIRKVKNGSVSVGKTTGDVVIGKAYKGMYQLKVNSKEGDIAIG